MSGVAVRIDGMLLRCFYCSRMETDSNMSVEGRNDMGDDISACSDCALPPHVRAEPRLGVQDVTEPIG